VDDFLFDDDEYGDDQRLCRADYKAIQALDQVVLIAVGRHPTGGYRVTLDAAMAESGERAFVLRHTSPRDVVLQVETSFAVSVCFEAARRMQTITTYDSLGKHSVPVEQVPAEVLREVGRCRG
jgi:hypothetical protein